MPLEIPFTSYLPTFNRDTKILLLQRLLRSIAYGTSTLILIQYLSLLPGFTPASIGLFQAATLWGDAIVSLVLTVYADRLGRRRVLLIGCLGMVGAGGVFAWGGLDRVGRQVVDGWWRWTIMSFASIIGVISPSGNEVGPFKALEESMLADLNPSTTLATIYAYHSLLGSAGAALGMFACGWSMQYLREDVGVHTGEGENPVDVVGNVGAYRIAFLVYAGCGIGKALLTMMLSEETEGGQKGGDQGAYEPIKQDGDVEADGTGPPEEPEGIEMTNNVDRTPVHGNPSDGSPAAGPAPSTIDRIKTLLTPSIPPRYLPILTRLSLIFAIDSIGSGLASASWMTFYFDSHFSLPPASLGTLFTVTNLISSGMALVAARLARTLGNLPTMVITHLPSAVFLASLPLARGSKTASIVLVLCRSALQSMDAAPRQAFIAGAVDRDGRTAIMGIINVVKTASQSLGPFGTGLFAQAGYLVWGIGMGGVMKIVYNLTLIWMMTSSGAGARLTRQGGHGPT